MEIDKTTLNDLSIFNGEEDFSILSKLNHTLTTNGKEQLRKTLATPLQKIEDIRDVQATLQLILRKEAEWPMVVSNGTIMVVERFYEYNFDLLPNTVTSLTALNYKMLHGPDYSLIKYSIIHCFDFIKGMQQFIERYLTPTTPTPMRKYLEIAQKSIAAEPLKIIFDNKDTILLILMALFILIFFNLLFSIFRR